MNRSQPIEPVSTPLRAGVVGVGAMGENHARVYSELADVELIGVADLDESRAARVARSYGAEQMALEVLLEHVDVATVAVPTAAHYETVRACLEAGVHVLVEKPIADDPDRARDLAARADEAGLVLQVGHVERFNPAVEAVTELIDDLEVIAVEAERLGPPVDRTAVDPVTLDLLIHDVDVVSALLQSEPDRLSATGTADGQYATATLVYDDGVVADLTASRVTQKKVRRLTVTAEECLVEVDYLEQSVLIHRESAPTYERGDGRNRYRHESVVERQQVKNREPLHRELEAFLEAVSEGSEPVVTAADGIRALETVQAIERLVSDPEDGLEVRVP